MKKKIIITSITMVLTGSIFVANSGIFVNAGAKPQTAQKDILQTKITETARPNLIQLGEKINLPVKNDEYYQNAYQEMVNDGVMADEANAYIKNEKILKEMEDNGQTITEENAEIKVVSSAKTTKKISKENETFIVNYVNNVKNNKYKVQKTRDQAINDLQQQIQKNPGKSKVRITNDDGSWYEIRQTFERTDKITDDKVKTYGNIPVSNETEVGWPVYYSSAGNFTQSYELVEKDAAHYAKNKISDNFTVTGRSGGPGFSKVHINSISSGQSSYGLITITNAARSINAADCTSDATWAEAENQVVYNFGGSAGFTIKGIFSISVNIGASWTQYALLRESLVATHSYAGYYY